MLKLPVLDVDGEKLGVVNDFGIATGEVFPHVTSLAFRGPGKTPFMISWRKWVDRIDETGVYLKASATEIRFSYLQPTELLLARDVLNKQIVDTQGMKVVRVNDIKFSMSGENQLRLLGAEVGARGLLRAISPALEHIVEGFMKHLGKPLSEDIIAWSYMDLLDRSTKNIQLSVSHKTLGELHPADIADIIEQLDPRLRAQVFAQLDTAQAAEAISEFDDDELMTEMLEGLSDTDASSMLAMMDPDDAADLIDELDYEKAEKLLRLMGVKEEKAIRNLLGYEDNTAGRIMTSEFVSCPRRRRSVMPSRRFASSTRTSKRLLRLYRGSERHADWRAFAAHADRGRSRRHAGPAGLSRPGLCVARRRPGRRNGRDDQV